MGSVTVVFALLMLCIGTLHAHYNYYWWRHETAFSAVLTKSYQSSGRIYYNKVHLNTGYGYSTSTGKFHAPYSGLYSFTYNYKTYSTYAAYVYLYHNSKLRSFSYAYNSYNGYANGGNTVILALHKGDYVWTYCSGKISGSSYTTFNGHMISPYGFGENAEKGMADIENKPEPKVEFASDEIENQPEPKIEFSSDEVENQPEPMTEFASDEAEPMTLKWEK